MGLVYVLYYIYHKNQPNVGKYTIHLQIHGSVMDILALKRKGVAEVLLAGQNGHMF